MFKKSVAIMALLAGLTATGAEALNLKQGAQPAEQPPAGFKGNTYVDSRGCVYIRAGFGGSVTWVPRVSRDRKVVCGARPSVGGAPSVVASPKVAPKPTPKQVVTPPKPTAKPQARVVTVAPQRQRVVPAPVPGPELPPRIGFGASETNPALPPRSAGPKPWGQRQVQLGQVPSAQVPTVAPVANLNTLQQAGAGAVRAPKTSSKPAPQTRVQPRSDMARIVADSGQSARAVRVKCPAKLGKVAFVRLNGAKLPIRCGPQQVAPVTYLVQDASGSLTRITTMPHASNVQASLSTGYAGQSGVTAAGRTRNFGSVPTQTVLVPQGNGQPPKSYQVVRRRDLDKSALPADTVIAPQTYIASNMPITVPKGYKPAWDDGRLNPMRGVRTVRGDAQTAQIWHEGVPYHLKGVELPEDTPRGAKIFGTKRARGVTPQKQTRFQKAPISGTRSVSATRASHRFVQVGGYGDPVNAKKVIIRLQRMGLKVSSSTSKSGVKTILAGPFAKQQNLTSALGKLRRAGFKDAFCASERLNWQEKGPVFCAGLFCVWPLWTAPMSQCFLFDMGLLSARPCLGPGLHRR